MRPYLLFLSLLLTPNLIFSESLGGLESLQKQSADAIKNAGSASEDLMALDFLAGKIRQGVWKFPYPQFDSCPSSEEAIQKCLNGKEDELPESCVCTVESETKRIVIAPRPQFFLGPEAVNFISSLVPVKEIRKQKQSPASSSCDQTVSPFFLPPSTTLSGPLFCANDPEATVSLLKDSSEVASLEDRGKFLSCGAIPGLISRGAELSCECVSESGEIFIKNGNNGTVSCQTFCSGSQWPGGIGTCRIAFQQAFHQPALAVGPKNKRAQTGYLSIPAPIPALPHPQDPRKDFLTNPNKKIPRIYELTVNESGRQIQIPILKPKRVQLLGYINDFNQPLQLKAIRVQAGNTTADITLSPEESSPPPQCQVVVNTISTSRCRSLPGLPTLCIPENTDIDFSLFQTSGIAVTGSFAEHNLNHEDLFPQFNETSKNLFIKKLSRRAPTKNDAGVYLKAIQQEPNSSYKQGVLQVKGKLVGPASYQETECVGEVTVRYWDPPAPECITMEVGPSSQEPELPVEVRVVAKNEITSANLVNHTTGQSLPITFSPTPGLNTAGSATITFLKSNQDDLDENIEVILKGPGAPEGVSCGGPRLLRYQRPHPPSCVAFEASPQELVNQTQTRLTLKGKNRIESAQIRGSNGMAIPIRLENTDEAGNKVGSIDFLKPDNTVERLEAQLTSRWGETTCHVNLNCKETEGPLCNLRSIPEKAKDGDQVTLELECPSSAQITSASIESQPVTFIGGKASITFTKSGDTEEVVAASVQGSGSCVREEYPSTKILGVPPCRFSDPNHSETLRIPIWKWNTFYRVYPLQSGTRLVTRRTGRNRTTVTELLSCDCGQTIQNDGTADASCVNEPPAPVSMAISDKDDPRLDSNSELYMGQTLTTTELFFDDAEALVQKDPNLCMTPYRNRMSLASTNEVRVPRDKEWEIDFQYKLLRTNVTTDKTTNRKSTTKYEVVNNLDIFDVGNSTPVSTSVVFRPEPVCRAECDEMNYEDRDAFIDGSLCLSQRIEGQTRRRRVGGRWVTYLDNDAVCEKESLIGVVQRKEVRLNGRKIPFWTTPVPGHFKKNVRELNTGRLVGVDKICQPNHACLIEKTAAHAWNVSDTLFWVEVGPLDRETCKVTRIDTAVTVRDKGCFTADTPITMANGKEKLVSDIRSGEYVFNPHYRTGIRVKKVVKGPEPKPLFEVALNGKKIKVTEDHPFFTERGWVQTLALKKGDKLFGEGKGKVVESVRKLPYKKPVDVWNFELDTEDPLAHIVMANGVPTGDLVTQLELKKPARKLP